MKTEILSQESLGRQLSASSEADSGIDYLSKDGVWGIQIKLRLNNVRDLNTGILALGRWVGERPALRRGLLILPDLRVSWERIQAEWAGVRSVLRSDVAERVQIVAPGHDPKAGGDPDWLGPLFEALLGTTAAATLRIAAEAPLGRKPFELVKLLLLQWLRREEPAPVLSLGARAGCSYPTVLKTLARLERRGEVERTRGRRPYLVDFPRRTWDEATALLPSLRETACFIDASGRPPDPSGLLERVLEVRPSQVALGGVHSARHWDPHFNLRGVPRLDLVVHAPDERSYDLDFVTVLDPALRALPPTDPRSRHETVLAVHRLSRMQAAFEKASGGGLFRADPVETLLDLHELGLVEQAEDLIGRLRGGR